MLGVGSNKVVHYMEATSQKLSKVTLIKRSLKLGGNNYTPRYTYGWNGRPTHHYNYTGMKKVGQLFLEKYYKLYSNYIED